MRILTPILAAVTLTAVVTSVAACNSSKNSADPAAGGTSSQAAAVTTANSTAGAPTSASAASSGTASSGGVPTSPAAAKSFPPATGACKLVTPQEIQQTVGVQLISVEQKTHSNGDDECLYGVTKASGLTLGVGVTRSPGGASLVTDRYGKYVDFPGHKAVWYGAMLYIVVGNDELTVDLTGAVGHQTEETAAAVMKIALSRM